jgi:hypothetical protein
LRRGRPWDIDVTAVGDQTYATEYAGVVAEWLESPVSQRGSGTAAPRRRSGDGRKTKCLSTIVLSTIVLTLFGNEKTASRRETRAPECSGTDDL